MLVNHFFGKFILSDNFVDRGIGQMSGTCHPRDNYHHHRHQLSHGSGSSVDKHTSQRRYPLD